MTRPELRALLEGMAPALKQHVAKEIAAAVEPLVERIKELEQREYQGVWTNLRSYSRGALVTRAGSVWHSNVNGNRAKPGEHPHWTLAVKCGRDGRDGGPR